MLLPLQTPSSVTQRHRLPPSAPARIEEPADTGGVPDAGIVEPLAALLHSAATTDLTDLDAWDRLRAAARGTLGAMVAGGVLPRHLGVGPGDPPVVVSRTLAAAWMRVTNAPRQTFR